MQMCASRYRPALGAATMAATLWLGPAADVAAQPPPPTLTYPIGTITESNPTYRWNAVSTATQYFVQVGDGVSILNQGNYTTAQVCSGSTCAINFGRNLAVGSYWWGVQAKNAAGGTWSTVNFNVQPPPAPAIVYPTGSVIDPNPNYAWSASPGATEYFVQVGDGIAIVAQGLYTTAQVCAGSSCAVNLARNLAVGAYWWGVQARNPSGGTWSTVNFNVLPPPAATLVSPSGAVYVPNPVYTWNASPGATGYFVQVADLTPTVVAQGSYSPASVCAGSTCSVQLPQSLALGSYNWWVSSSNASGATWSAAKAFSIQAPSVPVLTAPSGTITVGTPTYRWNASAGASEYYLQVNNGSAPVIALVYGASQVCSGSTCALTPGQSLSVGSYTWWIQARAAAGNTWSSPMSFSVQGPAAPALVAPIGSVTTATPTFQWSASGGATGYRLEISNGLTPTQYGPFTAAQVCSGSACAYTPTTTLPTGSYTWTAQAQNSLGWGPWAMALSFTVTAATQAPTLITPNGPMTAPTATYTWTVSPGATEYFLQVDDSTGTHRFSGTFTAGAICGASTCSATPSVTLNAGDHVWRVQAKNGPGGPWSADKAFTVGGCGGQFSTGDFNGDGKTDRLCSGAGGTFVSISTGTGFQTSTPWLTQSIAKPQVGDFDRDGRADVAELNTSTAVFSVALSNGTGFGPLTSWGTAQTAQGTCAGSNARAGTGDFNGDGRTDVSCKLSGYDGVFVGLSNGSTFAFTVFGYALCDAAERTGTLDVNGDGKDDWYCLGIENNLLLVFRSTGTSFVPQEQAVMAGDSSFCDDADVFLGDWNGDGKTDVACKGNGKVRLSTGDQYVQMAGTSAAWCTPHPGAIWPFAFGADVDGDGTAEMVCAGTGSAGAGIHVRKWLGTALGGSEVWLGGFCFGDIRPGDFNGDGKPDILCDHSGAWASSGTPRVRGDLMSQSAGGLGGSVAVEYVPSTDFPNEPGFGPRPVARRVTTSDGRTSASVTNYAYEGGKVDFVEKRSLGFRKARVTLPCIPGEPTCPYTETTFAQTVPSAGQPLDVRRYAGDNFLISKQTYAYTETTTAPRKSQLNRADSFTYDRNGGSRQTHSTFPVYDAYGNLRQSVSWGESSVSGDELQTDFTYVPNTSSYIVNKVSKVERRVPGQAPLQIEEYEYDAAGTQPQKGDLTAVSRWLDRASRNVTRRTTYTTKGDVQTVTDETNRSVTTTYHPAPHDFLPKTITNAANEVTELTWDNRCQAVTSMKDPNGKTTGQTYDNYCRPSRTTDPLDGYVQRLYQNLGTTSQKTRTENPPAPGASGVDWSEDYFDGLGRTYKSVKRGPSSVQSIVVDTTYNARSGILTRTEPYYANATPESIRATAFEYDEADRLTATVLPDNARSTTEYLANGQITTDPNGKKVTTRVTGPIQEAERIWNGAPSITTTTFDAFGRRLGLEDAKGHTWTYGHDSLNRLWHEYDPDAGHWEYDYDDAGRPTTQTDAKGQVTTLTYDAVGRIATKVSPVGTVTYTYNELRSGYFNKGRLTTITSPADTLQLDYDELGRTKHQQRVINGITYTVTKAWDAGGYLLGTTYPDNDTVGTATTPLRYDQAGRLKSIPGFVSSITYDAAGRPTQKKNAGTNGATTTWTYDPDRGFLERILTTSPAVSPIQDLTYGYDAAGLVRSLREQVGSTTPPQDWTYEYDDFYHLTEAQNTTTPAYSQTWVYDEIGRIKSNSLVGAYTYPQPTQPSPHAPKTVNGGPERLYDANGNLTSAPNQTLLWDGENRLAQTVVNGTTTTFTYDSTGERFRKASGSNTSIYPFGDDYEVRNGTVTKYISVEGLGVVAKRVGTSTFWIFTDRLGSIQAVTNNSGTIVRGRTYRPYGETLTTNGSHTEFRGWIDQRNDSESGFTYLHARYFDPNLGQFLSRDPIGVDGGLNQYAYGFGDPINRTDRSGLGPCSSWGPSSGPKSRAPIGECNEDSDPLSIILTYNAPLNPYAAAGGGSFLLGLILMITAGDSPHPGGGPGSGMVPVGPGGVPSAPPPMAGNPKQGPGEHPGAIPPRGPDDPPTPPPSPPDGPVDGGDHRRPLVSYHDVEQRLAAFWDGVIPFGDPFSDLYQDCYECWVSQDIGEWTRNTELVLVAGRYVPNNPILRFGRGWKKYPDGSARQIWRFASGGRWGKGGPKLPWHWHLP